MIRGLILLLTSTVVGLSVVAQSDTLRAHYATKISEDSLRRHLFIISSDEFEGRETGEEGQKKAAKYLGNKFEEYGLEQVADSGYFQRYHLTETAIDQAQLKVGDSVLSYISDFYFFGAMVGKGVRALSAVQFLGYGIDDSLYSDYQQADTSVKNIIIWQDEPIDKKGNYLVSGGSKGSRWGSDFSIKINAARERGVENLFIINEDYDETVSRLSYYLLVPRLSVWKAESTDPDLAVYFISENTAKIMLGDAYDSQRLKKNVAKSGKSEPYTVTKDFTVDISKSERRISTENVVGLVRGEEKSNEFVVVTAHYDHLGMMDGEIYNGADDDGSGTVALLEMARVMSRAKSEGNGPQRSVLFLAVSGEEKGLLGSAYYTANPVVPLNQTVTNLNIDMIGRNDANHEANSEYVYLIGSDRLSTTLHQISESVNKDCCNIELDYTYNDPNDPNRFYYRSDHYNFIKNGIPAIFYFSGVHEDYHQPGDTADKIQYEKMTAIVKLIFSTAWEVANTDKAIEVDVREE